MKFILFCLELFLTNIFFSLIIGSVFFRFAEGLKVNIIEVLICSFGFAPFLTTLLLYYSFLFIPEKSELFYFYLILFFYTAIGILNLKCIRRFFVEITKYFKSKIINPIPLFDESKKLNLITSKFPNLKNVSEKINMFFQLSRIFLKNNFVFILILTLIVLYVKFWFTKVINNSLVGHDVLEYATQGRIFFQDRFIHYVRDRFDENSSFYYVGLHGHSFALLATWGNIMGSFAGYFSDYFFKSITGYYTLLIFLLQFYLLQKRNVIIAFLGSFLLFFTFGFFLIITEFHVDSYRIWSLCISWYFLVKLIKVNNRYNLVIFSIFCGMQANIHSLGALISIFNLIVLFFFIDDSIKNKFIKSLVSLFIILLFGGIHYILDTFFGTGWIFQEIKYY